MKPFNINKFVHFVLLPEVVSRVETVGPNAGRPIPTIGSLSFRTYTDTAGVFDTPGAPVEYITTVDANGRPKGKWFKMDQSHNAIIVNINDVDVKGKKMIDFIRNHPDCEGSKNGRYITDGNGDTIQINVKFRELNTEQDAQTALAASLRRSKAQLSAGELDFDTLKEVAILGIGMSSNSESILRHKVVEWAGKRPQDYFTILDSGDRQIRAQVRKAITDGIFTERGPLIYWGNEIIGSNEDDAVSKLLNDEELRSALKEKTSIEFKKTEPKPTKKK